MLHLKAVAGSRVERIGDIVLCTFGLVAMAYTTTQTINTWASAPQEVKTPDICDM